MLNTVEWRRARLCDKHEGEFAQNAHTIHMDKDGRRVDICTLMSMTFIKIYPIAAEGADKEPFYIYTPTPLNDEQVREQMTFEG